MLNERQQKFLRDALYAMLTISEAAAAFKRHRNTIRYHINRDNVQWRQTSEGYYLISRESLIALYGLPR